MSFEQPEWKILCRMKDDDRVDGKGDEHTNTFTHTCMLFLLTSQVSQLSVEKAIDSNATETIAAIVASDSVTAEHGIFVVC